MSCDKDAETRHTLDCFRDRLKRLIQVEPLLDLLHFLEPDRKDRIKAKFREEGNISAATLLIDEIIHSKNCEQGWSRELVTALETVGCKHAAKYVLNSPPEPTEEAENDSCVRLIDLLQLTLVNMKTADVCAHCRVMGLLTQEDQENILKLIENQGNIGGARLLLKRLVKNEAGWFSKFLQALEDTEHHELVRELRGEPCNEDGEAHKSSPVTDKEFHQTATGSLRKTGKNSMSLLPPVLSANSSLLSEDLDSSVDSSGLGACADNEGEYLELALSQVIVPLVEQHYKAEFGRFLKHQYSVERVSGASQLKISFPQIIEQNDIIICTAQILENSLAKAKNGDEDGIKLSQFTLMVIDECHHTKKGGVYNHIMIRYLKQKHQNQLLKKQDKSPVPLPQILGLTASPGVGGAMSQQRAEEHILQICANLDAFTIKTKTFEEEEAKTPFKRIARAEERKEVIPLNVCHRINIMKCVISAPLVWDHNLLTLMSFQICIGFFLMLNIKENILKNDAAKEENQKVRVCAEHLRQYNEALHQSNTIRMSDAFRFLDKYHNEELKTKSIADEEGTVTITDTERFLFTLFKDNKAKLQELMGKPQYENNSLAQLKTNILKEFSTRERARGIIFTRTRLSAIALCQWIQENPKFDEVGVSASYLIGGGDQSVVKPMTAAEQKDVLNKFRDGQINLLIATTVAEEGLDIAECNFVIRYCLVTNEIAMIQARGRGRAEDSSYTLVAEAGSGVAERESVNEYREKMMSKAIAKVCKMNRADYEKKIREFQMQAIMEEKVKIKKKQQKGMMKEPPSKISLSCRQCSVFVCSGEDIEKIENMHHVNVTTQFSKLITVRENASLQERLLDYETNGVIACKNCGQQWGSMMLYKSIECPCLHIKNFVVTYGSKKKTFSKWSELPIKFPAFDYTQHADLLVEDSGEEEDMETD
uniref:RNA helicase n=1 Tax=Cyprinus carpio TaxID=7962 RepID=A0A8C2PYF6_CYPCA